MNLLFWFMNVAIAIILLYLRLRVRRRKMYELTEKIPGPPSYPLIGIMHMFVGKNNEEVLQVVDNILTEYKSPAKVWLGPRLIIFVDSPIDLKIILNSPNCLQKLFLYEFLGVNKGLMAAPAHMWKVHRKYLNLCFNPKLLESFLPIFNRKSKTMVKRMSNHLGKGAFDVYTNVGKCTLDMICNTAMGLDSDFQNADGDLYLESADIVADRINRRIFNLAYHPKLLYKYTQDYKEHATAWKAMQAVAHRVIKNYKQNGVNKYYTIEENNNEPLEEQNNNDEKQELRKPKLFIEKIFDLADAVPDFDEQSIMDEIDTLIAGGNETSALAVSFCLLMLAMHPDIQERVVNEMRSVFKTADENVTLEAIGKLPYLQMVLSETLRLFPITPLIGREVQKDMKLDQFVLPAGASILMPIYKVHRNKEIWGPDSNSFNPDNFLPENIQKRHPYSYIPFSSGPRNCIGWKYSLMAMKTMLCHALRTYTFTTDLKYTELRLKMCLDLKITNKHMVRILERTF